MGSLVKLGKRFFGGSACFFMALQVRLGLLLTRTDLTCTCVALIPKVCNQIVKGAGLGDNSRSGQFRAEGLGRPLTMAALRMLELPGKALRL